MTLHLTAVRRHHRLIAASEPASMEFFRLQDTPNIVTTRRMRMHEQTSST
jgi:hypothetical protein